MLFITSITYIGGPSFSGRRQGGGGGGVWGGGCGQDRARGRHLTAANALPAFGRFDQFGGGGGGGLLSAFG